MEKQTESVIFQSEKMMRVFDNDLILQGIAVNLPLSEVKVLRTVNSKWSSAFHKAFYNKTSITFKDSDAVLKYFNEMHPAVNSSFIFSFNAPLNDAFYEGTFFPKFGYWIASLTLRQIWEGPEDYLEFQKFLIKFTHLKELHLHLQFRGNWPDVEDELEVAKLPRIRKLSVQIHPKKLNMFVLFQMIMAGENFPQIEPRRVLPLIWQSFPSVEALRFDDRHCSEPHDSLSTPILLQQIPKLFPKLSGLHLKCNEKVLTDLLNLDFELQLSALTLDFTCLRWDSAPPWNREVPVKLNEMLERHKSTLKSLKLILVPPRKVSKNVYRFELKFPLKMERLQTLSLTFPDNAFVFGWNKLPRFSIRHFNFDDFCPNLKKYELKVKHGLCADLYKGERPLDGYKELLRRHFIPSSVCLNVEEVLVPYSYVKGADWLSKKKDAKLRMKNYEDFVERLTLTFPNAVKEGVFPKPRPEEDKDNDEGDAKNWKLMADF